MKPQETSDLREVAKKGSTSPVTHTQTKAHKHFVFPSSVLQRFIISGNAALNL